MTILVTGAAGFIGHAVSQALLNAGQTVLAVDNLNDYYSVKLKAARLATLQTSAAFTFVHLDIADQAAMAALFASHDIHSVIHLAAQAGVRYSLVNPSAYTHSNLIGTACLLDLCHRHQIKHVVLASSSSVYGRSQDVPFREDAPTDAPVSYYAATKKSNEVMAYSYSALHGLPITVLRFFTVYGPWGRPDMAPWLFTEAILAGKPIKVFNNGLLQRDFTYVRDIVEGVLRISARIPNAKVPYALYNIGNHQPVPLMDFVATLEGLLGVEADKLFLPMQEGDVHITCADTTQLHQAVGFSPATPLSTGLAAFVDWYRDYHQHT